MEPWPSDQHNIPAEEDLWHEDTPDCTCRPRLIGLTAEGKRLFEHKEMAPIFH